MYTLLILLVLYSFFLTICSGIAFYIAWKSLVAFMASEEQKEEYRRYIRTMTEQIQESSAIFRTELARRMGLDIPQVKDLNNMLHELETKMNSFREVLSKFLTEGD